MSFRPQVVVNAYPPSFASTEERDSVLARIEAVENLVLHLAKVLSDGLYAGLDLWSVLQTLERIDGRLPSDEARAMFRFAPNLIQLIKSSMPKAHEFIKTKAFLRLALNGGYLLASLELLGEFNDDIVTSYMMDHALIKSRGSAAWDKFVRSVSQIAGPPLEMLSPGFSCPPPVVTLHLTPYVAALDEDAERVQQQKLYVSAIQSALPPFTHPVEVPIRPLSPPPSAGPQQDSAGVAQVTPQKEGAPPSREDGPSSGGAADGSGTRKVVKRVVRKRTIIKKVLRPSVGGASSIGDDESLHHSVAGGSDNDHEDDAAVAGSPTQPFQTAGYDAALGASAPHELTRRQYITGESISKLLEQHHQNMQRLMAGEDSKRTGRQQPAPDQLERHIGALLAEGTREGWYFEIDEKGVSTDRTLRCSRGASDAIDAALAAAEELLLRRRALLLQTLATRETELMELEDGPRRR